MWTMKQNRLYVRNIDDVEIQWNCEIHYEKKLPVTLLTLFIMFV